MPRLLELFCGTKSVGNVFNDYEVISLDFNPKFNATHTVDILQWDFKQYAPDFFDVIWASPDCTTFTLATGGRYRTRANIYGLNNAHQHQSNLANAMVLKVIEILKYFNCKTWFMENPRGLLQYFPPLIHFIKDTNSHKGLIYYGNHGWGFPKPTNIWSNLPLWTETKPIMKEDTYQTKTFADGRTRRMYNTYNFKKSEERSKIPEALIQRLKLLI
jgi:site-specific DNA-cytosine methylase